MNKYKIALIKTQGCESCSIMAENIETAVAQTKRDVEVVEYNRRDLPKEYLKQEKIKDFPTTLFMVNDIIKYKAVGSYPSAVVLRWIDIHFT